MRSRGAKPPQGAWRAVGRNDGAVTADGEHGRTREMLAGSVRFVPRPVTKGGAGALFLITWHAPRRFPDLVRVTANAGFALLHDPAAGWTGSRRRWRVVHRDPAVTYQVLRCPVFPVSRHSVVHLGGR